MVAYSFEGWNAHQSLGMLITRRMESAGLKPLGFVANDYALACYGLEPVADPRAALLARHPRARVRRMGRAVRTCCKRAFREVAVIGGLVERQHPGKRKTGSRSASRPTSSTTCCATTSPTICCSRAAWDDARARMTEVGRLARLLDRAAATMVHVELDRVTPMAVPVMVIVGREALPPGGDADEALLLEAEALAEEAMRIRLSC